MTGPGKPVVLWLIKGLGPGGAERLLVEQARASRGCVEYHVAYLLEWKSHLVEELRAAGVGVTCLSAAGAHDPRWVARLVFLLRRLDPDVLHVHSPALAAVLRPLLRAIPSRPALVSTEHNRWPRHHPATRLANRLTCRLDDLTLAVSEDVRLSMSEPARSRTKVIQHGIDVHGVAANLASRDEVRAELGLRPADFVFGTVANLRREKAHEVLVAAARRVVQSDPNARFVSVGQGPLEDRLREMLDRHDLQDRFLHLGYRPDAVRIMSAFDAFVLSSRHEGLPVALMEALALGLPVVATRVGGIPDAVGSGDDAAGLLVDPDRPDLLAEALLRVCRDRGLAAVLSSNARRKASAFSARHATERLERLYTDLTRLRRNHRRRPADRLRRKRSSS